MSIVNRKVFKVTCYFINNLKNLKLKQPLPERVFDWQVVYVEAETRASTKALVISVTEDDIYRMVRGLLDREVNAPGLPQGQ